jgi:two-component system sensor histidine kinase CiaH
MRKEKIALRVLYILAIYVLLQLIWWGYQLVQLNARIIMSNESDVHAQYLQLRSKVWMVAGEGIVFFLLLAIGFRYIQRTVSRELAIARKEKNFLLSVTHELKTPIAAVKLFLETLQTRTLSDDKRRELLQQSVQETKRLQSLTENILMAARLDGSKEAITSSIVQLSDLVEQEVRRFEKIFGVSIGRQVAASIRVRGDEQMLSVLIGNLIDNALKYGSSKPLRVELQQSGGNVLLAVSDHGPGIPLGEEKRIFEKFYRIGNEETRTSKGTGLGLFIVDAVARMHGAEVTATNTVDGGALFTVKFKKQNDV